VRACRQDLNPRPLPFGGGLARAGSKPAWRPHGETGPWARQTYESAGYARTTRITVPENRTGCTIIGLPHLAGVALL